MCDTWIVHGRATSRGKHLGGLLHWLEAVQHQVLGVSSFGKRGHLVQRVPGLADTVCARLLAPERVSQLHIHA